MTEVEESFELSGETFTVTAKLGIGASLVLPDLGGASSEVAVAVLTPLKSVVAVSIALKEGVTLSLPVSVDRKVVISPPLEVREGSMLWLGLSVSVRLPLGVDVCVAVKVIVLVEV